MLIITVPGVETFNEETNEFGETKPQTIKLEHSLVSVSKWEAKWQKPFLATKEKTFKENLDYIKCMVIGQCSNETLSCLTQDNVNKISEYINSPMTATWFNENGPKRPNREIITSELIYYWMVAYNIPFECEKWHLNRLLTLIRICGIKMEQQNGSNKKMSKSAILSKNQALNAQRRAKLNSNG